MLRDKLYKINISDGNAVEYPKILRETTFIQYLFSILSP